MGEFFHGWRRKAGCVTLVLATVFMLGWIRSMGISDGAVIQFVALTHVLISTDGHFRWMCHSGNFPTSDRITHLQWPVEQAVEHPFIAIVGGEIEWQWRCRWRGFDIGEGHIIGLPLNAWAIPYWSVVLPLTALSAFLLLSKPRKSTPKKLTEPIPAEGA